MRGLGATRPAPRPIRSAFVSAAAHGLGDARGAERWALRGAAAALLRGRADELEHLGGEIRRGREVAGREVGLERLEPVHAQPGALADEQPGVDVPRMDALLV